MKEWNKLIFHVHSWNKKTRSRILGKCNRAEKEIIKSLEMVEPDSLSAWSLISSIKFKRLIQASFEYDERDQRKMEKEIVNRGGQDDKI